MHKYLRPSRIMPTAAIALLLAALAPAVSAQAVDSGRQTVSNSSNVCVQTRSQFNWYDTGFGDHKAYGETYANKPGCSGELYRPNGWMATRLQTFKWDGARWNVCHETAWAYGGGGDTRSGDLTFEQQVDQYDFFTAHRPPCGAGWYGNLTSSYVWTGSAWEGSALWSGNTFAS